MPKEPEPSGEGFRLFVVVDYKVCEVLEKSTSTAEVRSVPRSEYGVDADTRTWVCCADHLSATYVDRHVVGSIAKEEDQVAGAQATRRDVRRHAVLRPRVVGQ